MSELEADLLLAREMSMNMKYVHMDNANKAVVAVFIACSLDVMTAREVEEWIR